MMMDNEHVDLSSLLLSTMWMQHRFDRLSEFAATARGLGFAGIEVSHLVTPAMIGDAHVAALGIGAVHFPAPAQPSPFGQPAEALLSSPDENARRWAVQQGYASIDFAGQAGAAAICLHLGEAPAPAHLEWALRQRYLGGQRQSEVYAAALAAVEEERRALSPLALAAAQRSLDELAGYARPRGIRLGIESRVHHGQIPTWSELGQLLAGSDPQVVGFWYDCGHVQVLHNLGFHQHEQWLAAYGQRIVGVHLHDVVGLRDHLLPGQGEIDFAWLAASLPAAAVRTCEFDWYFHDNEIVQGARHLVACGCTVTRTA